MNIKDRIISFLNKLPHIRGLYQEKMFFEKNSCFLPGHYYSPIVDVDKIKMNEGEIWKEEITDRIPGINLNTNNQINLTKVFQKYYPEIPFGEVKQDNIRYYFENGFYSYTDAITLFCMIRHYKPKRIIEIGSGFSSAIMLDTNELFFENQIKLTFIEPYPERLHSLLKDNDKETSEIITSNVQAINKDFFNKLEADDILFVDSSHVVKTGGDVNFVLFEILPELKPGVLIHFHDIFHPFEYPKEWVFGGRNWNECYFLRAFLMHNHEFSIKYFSHYLHLCHKEVFSKMPMMYKNFGGNLWVTKNMT